MHPSIHPLFNQLARVQARALWGKIVRMCSNRRGLGVFRGLVTSSLVQTIQALSTATHEESVTPYRNIIVTLSLSMQTLSHPFPSSLPARYHVISKDGPTAVTS
jgi:hypothetical protein